MISWSYQTGLDRLHMPYIFSDLQYFA